MANTKSQYANGSVPQPIPAGSEVVNILLDAEVAAADLALGDLVILGEIPADCVLVDAVYAADDLDAGATPALALEFGTINSTETGLATTIETGITIGQAGGAARMTPTVAALNVLGGTSGTPIGFRVSTAAASGQAGTLMVSLSYRSALHDK